METSIHRRRRILLHFFLGIGLPSLLLGYLAFRGIQNDMALLEKEQLNEHNTIAQQITNSINDKISALEEAFLDSITNHQASHPDSAVLRLLERLKSRQPLIEEVFLLESAEGVQLPLAKLLFLPGGSAKSLPPQPQPSALLLGQQYEFQQKRYQEALTSYQQAFAQVSDHQAKAEALNAIARVQGKSNLLADAIKSYQTIAQDYSDIPMGSGMPSGLAAQLELGALFLAIDDSSSAVQTFIRLYQDLIHAEWTLEKSQYEYFAQQVEESIDEIFSQDEPCPSKTERGKPMQSYQSTFRMLKGEEIKQREITERLLTFQGNAAPNLLAKVPQNHVPSAVEGMKDSQKALKRFTLDIAGRTYLVSIPGQRREEIETRLAVSGGFCSILNSLSLSFWRR